MFSALSFSHATRGRRGGSDGNAHSIGLYFPHDSDRAAWRSDREWPYPDSRGRCARERNAGGVPAHATGTRSLWQTKALPCARRSRRHVPDVVLLDVNLPGEDGFTLARFLRERYDVGIIMVTGATDVADRVTGLESRSRRLRRKALRLARICAQGSRASFGGMQARPIAAPVQAPDMGAASSRVCVGAVRASTSLRHQLFASDGSELPLYQHGVRPAQGIS
jgi:CheY-like chemotaxis protein